VEEGHLVSDSSNGLAAVALTQDFEVVVMGIPPLQRRGDRVLLRGGYHLMNIGSRVKRGLILRCVAGTHFLLVKGAP
jgi:hypothetical protein